MVFKSKYALGELIYLITDVDQLERIITGVKFNMNGCVYTVQCGVNESYHYEQEITRTKFQIMSMKNN